MRVFCALQPVSSLSGGIWGSVAVLKVAGAPKETSSTDPREFPSIKEDTGYDARFLRIAPRIFFKRKDLGLSRRPQSSRDNQSCDSDYRRHSFLYVNFH